jgi:hypothetical protein
MRSPRFFVSAAALAAFGLFLATSVPVALATSAHRLLEAFRHRGESTDAARVRVFGAPYVDSIRAMRRAIPPDGSYGLIDGEPDIEGAALWVRHDLAPRKAVFLGKLERLPGPRRLRSRLPERARWVVVAYTRRPPELIEKLRFLEGLEARRGR